MIWWLGLGLALVICLYLITPFLARDVAVTESDEVTAYREELRALLQSDTPADADIADIQARLLNAAKANAPQAGTRGPILPMVITLSILGLSVGLYTKLGSPAFEAQTLQKPPEFQTAGFEALLPQFEARLAENPDDATGWYLYGRALMLSGQSTAGLRAYERAIEISDDPGIRQEYEAAKTFAQQAQNGPSPDDIRAMQNLSETDQQAAIRGMVESLSARLKDAPNDPTGWERLLHSRKVLEQENLAKTDIAALRKALPDQADDIIAKTGWADLASGE